MNKKGFIFTFISITLISVIILAFLMQYTSRTRGEIERINTEVETLNSFVKTLNNNYLPTALKVSSNQAFISLLYEMDKEEGIRERGYIGGIDEEIGWILNNVIVNAIIDGGYKNGWGDTGSPLDLMKVNGINYSLGNTLDELVDLANYTNIKLEFNDITTPQGKQSMMVFQDNPWYVNISIVMSYTISNERGDITWSYNDVRIDTSVPLKNFVDPIHLIENDPGESNVSIIETVYTSPNDIEHHVFNASYVACSSSPSFLDRMEGKVDASLAGIESLYDIKSSMISAIDYQYYGLSAPTGILVQVGSSDYYIDGAHQGCHSVYLDA